MGYRYGGRVATDMTGARIGRLTVLDRLPNSASGRAQWLCVCLCGELHEAAGRELRRGAVKSCGCLLRTHRLSKTDTYRIWQHMKDRCHNPRNDNYRYYGGRGIRVCRRWRLSFEAFLADMGPRPPTLTIERIDNDKGYGPGNCRWATRTEQNRNQQRHKRRSP